ncbi:MAG TPA: hypothetical protein VHM31_10190 [Polyangia bacterium]|nr:hypothetical protein [Polyangia bacterium]
MGLRDEIIKQAKWWAAPGTYKPTADDFATIIKQSGCNVQPSQADLDYTIKSMKGGNVRIAGASKSWCGIFAVAVWANAGVGVKWTLNWSPAHGNLLNSTGAAWRKVWGNKGVQPGDIASIAAMQHHFIVTDVSATAVNSVDGNQAGNTIVEYTNWKHTLGSIVAYYTLMNE